MSDFLAAMATSSLLRAEALKREVGERGLRSRVASARPAQNLNLDSSDFDLIGEAKLASPSEGRLAGGGRDVVSLAESIVRSGAAAVSVLTEPDRFDGAMQDLETVAASVPVPVMRKDFLVDPVQVLEARAAGASGVLLIVKLLSGPLLEEMVDLASDVGMFSLVEVFDEADVDRAASVFDRPILVGVNSRDLTSLEVDPGRHAELVGTLPAHLPKVAESGVSTAEDVAARAALGYRLVLAGTALVRSGEPESLARAMIEAGRASSLAVRP